MKIPESIKCKFCYNDYFEPNQYLIHLSIIHKINLNLRICVHIPVYNDKIAINRTLETCRQLNLFCIINDGKFPGFKKINNSDNSTDGTKELAESYSNILYFQHGEDFEEAKFNFAMHLAAKMSFEYVILLGSDEWIVGDIDELIKMLDERMKVLPKFESQAFQVAVDEHQPENKWNKFITESPKIFYGPGLIRTRYSHWLRYCATCIARDNLDHPLYHIQRRICTIVIHHDDSIRGKERNKLMTKFQDKNVKREQKRVKYEALRKLFKITFFLSNRKLADWHTSFFLKFDPPYSHYLIYDDGVKITQRLVNQFHTSLIKNPDIPVLSAVYRVADDKSWRVTLETPKKRFATAKIEEIYTKSPYRNARRNYVLPLDIGPIVAIHRDVVQKISTITDKEQFREKCQQLGFTIYCDSGIQIKAMEKVIVH